MRKIILASQSPRRQEILKLMGLDYTVILNPVDEVYPSNIDKREVPIFLSKLKAKPFEGTIKLDEVLITSDTIVLIDDTILGKPTDRANAIEILKLLSGQKHEVITGVCLTSTDKQITFSDVTEVYFNEISIAQIEYYVDQFQPYDKAGAYAIQEYIGMIGIEKINGSYYNVMGLPSSKLYEMLNAF